LTDGERVGCAGGMLVCGRESKRDERGVKQKSRVEPRREQRHMLSFPSRHGQILRCRFGSFHRIARVPSDRQRCTTS